MATFRYYRRFDEFDLLNYAACAGCGTIYSHPGLVYSDFGLQELDPEHVQRRIGRRRDTDFYRHKEKLTGERMTAITSLLDGGERGGFCEIGCGFGDAMRVAEESGFEAVGTEMYQDYIDYCRDEGLDVSRGDTEVIPFDDEAFSVVFMEDVMEHLEDPFGYTEECVRVLKPGGVLFSHTWWVETATTVEDGFGADWRQDMNLDLTAHTTIFCRPALQARTSRSGLALRDVVIHRAMNESSPNANRGANVRFVDLYWKKEAGAGT